MTVGVPQAMVPQVDVRLDGKPVPVSLPLAALLALLLREEMAPRLASLLLRLAQAGPAVAALGDDPGELRITWGHGHQRASVTHHLPDLEDYATVRGR